jgi:hypothetical protein
MSLVYRRVDRVLSGDGDAGCEVCEGDCLLLETAGTPGAGDLALVRRDGVESLCRWDGDRSGEVLGIVVGIRRRL